jgi:hypothetical protein
MATSRFDQQQGLLAARLTFEQWEALSRAYRGIDLVNKAARRHRDLDDVQVSRFDVANALAVSSDVAVGLAAVNRLAGLKSQTQADLELSTADSP